MENLECGKMKAVDELLRGREFAKALKSVLNEPRRSGCDGSVLDADDLAKKILTSFTNTLSILNTPVTLDSDQLSQFPTCYDDGRKLEDSGDSCKSRCERKNRRGCYKRRKNSHSWTTDSPVLTEDGRGWRKYGQKQILHCSYPRNYFRCTHKYDQGCKAIKHVQQISEDPCVYRTTYYGDHTCNSPYASAELLLDGTERDTNNNSILLNFNNGSLTGKQGSSISFAINQPHEKVENYAAITGSPGNCNRSSSSHEYLMTTDDLSVVNSSITTTSTTSSQSLNMDAIVGSVEFGDDYLQF